ncbi:MAG TPA: HAD family hydrolase [Acidobacteriota bacterium]
MIEIIRPFSPRRFKVVVFDFDGTLSLLRTGWQQIMVDLMFETLNCRPPESESRQSGGAELTAQQSPGPKTRNPKPDRRVLRELVDQSTGRQTIDQMLILADLMRSQRTVPAASTDSGLSQEAIRYKHIYLRRLKQHMASRLVALQSGRCPAQNFLVAGASEFLQWLSNKGCVLCLISGTDQREVLQEARLLEIDQFFGSRVFGGLDETGAFSKLGAMRQVLSECNSHSQVMIAFGDGIVDIRSAKDLGTLAIGVASNEDQGHGLNAGKRLQLISAGADAVIGDYSGYAEWGPRLFGGQATDK